MRNNNHKWIAAIMVFFSVSIFAQTGKIAGTIADSATQKPLAKATVQISSLENHFLAIKISDSLGRFQFDSLHFGNYSIKASFVGYSLFLKKDILLTQENQRINLPIILKAMSGGNTAVIVHSTIPFITQTPDKITLNIASSPIAAGGNVYDAILRAPGMMEQNGSLSFRMQGSVEVLINGRPSHLNGDGLKNMLSTMPANRVEKIEVLPNPSAKYDATAGTIVNVILAKNQDYGANYTFTGGLGAGKYFKGNAGLDFNYRNKLMNVYGGYSYTHNKQYYDENTLTSLSNYSVNSTEHEVRSRHNNSYNLGTDFYLNKESTIGFMVNGYYNQRDRNVLNNSTLHINNTDSASSVATEGKANFSSPSVNVYYQTTFDKIGNALTVNADYFNYTKNWSENFVTNYPGENLSPTYLRDHSPANNNVYALSADFTHPNKKATWEFGIKSTYTKTDNNILWEDLIKNNWQTDITKTNDFIYTENINAGYVNYTRMLKKLRLQLGLRGEQTNTKGDLVTTNIKNDKHYFNLFPTVGLMYMKNRNNIFSLNYKSSIYRFDYNYVNPFIVYQNQYTYSEGNPNIQPMIFDMASLAYVYHQFLNISLAYTHVKKMISLQYFEGANNTVIQSYGNLNYGDYYTLSVTVQKHIGVWQTVLTGVGGYAHYVNSNAGESANNSWLGVVQWQNNFNFKHGWSIEENSSYSAPMASGATKIKQLFNNSVGFSKSLFKGDGSLKLGLTDIFNSAKPKIVYNNRGIITHTNSNYETRFLNLTFKYKFGNKHVKTNKERATGVSDLQQRMAN